MNESKRGQGCRMRDVVLLILVLFFAGCGDKTATVNRQIADAQQESARGNHSAAIIHLKNVLQEWPEHAEARYLLGVAYKDLGDFRAAEAELRRAFELRYNRAKVMPLLGKTLLTMGEFQKVLDQIRLEGDVGNPEQAEVLTLRALASMGLGRRAEGRQLLEQALAVQPEFAGALLGQAQLAASERKLDEAARLVERALASAPQDIDAWMMKGDLSRATADRGGASAAFQKVLEFSPGNAAARLNIASLHIDAGKFDEAGKLIKQVRKIAPNSPQANYLRALIEYRKKNPAAARDIVLQVLKASPDHLASQLLAGIVEFQLGSHAQAQGHLGQVLASAPGNLYARKLLIFSLAASGQVQRAIGLLQPVLEQAPQDAELMALAGEVYMRTNELAKATQYFEQAAKLDPKSAGVRTRLGQSRLASGESDRALADLALAGQLDSSAYRSDIVLILALLQRANYDQALKALGALEKKQPDNPQTHNLKAAIYIGKKDAAAARRSLERALELQPAYVPAATNLAQLDLQDKNPQAARRRLETILDKDKANVEALLALASLASRIGATQKEAIDWLESARKASPASVQPQLMLARLHVQAGDAKKGLEVALQAQAASPENSEVLDVLGTIQIAAGAKEQALATFGKLVKLQPDSPVALFRLATAQAVNADAAAAAATLEKALTLKPDFIDAQAALADLEIRAGHFPAALKIAQQMQKQNAKSPRGFVLEGDVMMAEKKYPQAINAYEIAYGIGRSTALVIKLHAASLRAGKPDEAEARLARWLKESPDDLVVRLYAADVSLKSGRHKIAIEHYEWVLGKQPDNVLALNNLAGAYQQVKDARALETAERAYKLKPDNAAVADTLGWILVEQGNTVRGLELLQKAVTTLPKVQEIRFHLAQAWMKTGDKVKAREELERIQSAGIRFPQEVEAANLLKQIKN